MSTPSIKVGQGNWGIKANNLLGYANTDKKFVARDFTVGRLLNTATRVNASGNIEGVLANVPRIDYFGGQASLLVEPSSQNLLLQSQDFSTTWAPLTGGTGVNPVITTNAVISPDGTQNAERVVLNRGAENDLDDQSTLQQNITIATSGAYIFSVYAKASTAGDVGKQVFIRIGFAGTLTPITLTANWVRYSRAESSVTSGSQTVQIGNRGTVTAGNSVSVDLWGAQAESGSVATSYIPTTTGSVTRNADVISLTGVAGLIGQTEGTIYAEVDVRVLGDGRFATLSDGTSNNRIQCRFNAALNGLDFLVVVSASSVGFSISNSSHPSFPATIPAGTYKIALGYKQNDYVVAMNGVAYTPTVTTRNVPLSFSKVTLGADVSDLNQFNNRIRAVSIYQTRLPNTTTDGSPSLQSITTL
jgi:hypothetical protein